jgi:hypothetical protein
MTEPAPALNLNHKKGSSGARKGSRSLSKSEEIMMGSKNNGSTLWAVILTLIIAIGLPSLALANPQGRGRGRGQDKKAEKFKNRHDARDGRWDGRGPRDRDDDDDRDDRDNGRGRRDRDRDRDDDGINDRTEIRRQAQDIGYREGYNAGRDDRASGRSRSYSDDSAYRDATIGYRSDYGSIDFYRSNFREGFRRGYEDGYRNRSTNGRSGGIGGVLGDIFGRP